MATIHYVDSAATGTPNGTSWTDAWTSLSSSSGVAAGDTIRVASTHVEATSGSTTTITWTAADLDTPIDWTRSDLRIRNGLIEVLQ